MLKSFARLWALLRPRERRNISLLAVATAVGALLEMVGVGAIPVFIGILNQPDRLSGIGALAVRSLGLATPRAMVIGGGAAMFALFLLKNVYGSFLLYAQGRFANSLFIALSNRLFERYLREPYTFHLARNSAELLRNTSQETNSVVQNVIMPGIMVATESMVALCIVLLVLLVEPVISAVAFGLLGSASFLFWIIIRKRSQELGESQLDARRWMIQIVSEALGGVKEVKLLGREGHFLDAYRRSMRNFAQAAQYSRLVSQLPRPFMETIAVAGLLVVGAVFVVQGRPTSTIVETMALFAIAVLRLLPSTQRIMASLGNIRFNLPSLNVVLTEIQNTPTQGSTATSSGITLPPAFEKSVDFCDVTFNYEGHDHAVITGVSLRIQKNQMVGFVGTSGSGKSTLMDVALGLLQPTSGKVLIDGFDLSQPDVTRWWQRQVGYIPQSIFLADATIRRNVAFGVDDADVDDSRVWSALEAAQLAEFVRAQRDGLDTHVGERGVRISGGQRQRIGIARALYNDPSILIMDEATSALDSETESEFVRAVERMRGNLTILVVAHRLTTVRACDRICTIESGQITSLGTYEETIGGD